tara:strand:+ start:311 stop:562 length:252 start_codon:yes stop_codon:yes gene_type:complete
MKITKRQLRRIIKEEKAKLLNEQADPGIFSEDYVYDMFADDIMDFLQMDQGGVNFLTEREVEMFRRAVLGAVDKLMEDYGEVR